MSEIIDNPTILPSYPTNPFEDDFKSKWHDRYKNGGCTKKQLQRLYNIDKLTEEDFKLITDELPSEKVIPQKSKVSELEDKINILKEENEKQDELIDTTLLATDEMYMMLEPLLASQVNLTSEYISRMAAMYVAMVQRGLKTIDEVPVRYREEVRAIIEN